MSKENIAKGIITGLNSIATPQSLTVQVVNGIINSEYTKETIRKFLLDPVQRKLTPSIKYHGYNDTFIGFYTLYKMCREELFDALSISDKAEKDFEKSLQETRPIYAIGEIIQGAKKPQSMILKHNGMIMYVQYKCNYEDYDYYFYIYFIGVNANTASKDFTHLVEEANYDNTKGYAKKNKRQVPIYTFEGGGRPRRSTCTVPNTIIVDHVEKDLETIIKSIKLSEDISKKYELNKTTGILLHGPHGTGKSTLVRYLAMKLGRTILLTGAGNLSEVINFIKDRTSYDKFIVLIEDIDFKFVDRRDTKKDDKNNAMMANTDLLFQLLDGVLSENNLVVCATTNYIDRLDPALIRDGRFDYRIEVLGLSYENAAKVCERFDISPAEIKLSEWETPISPATLQTFILKYKTSTD